MNASTWLGPLEIVQPVYGWVMPSLMLVTIVSNSLIITVLSRCVITIIIIIFMLHRRSSMTSPTNTVLLAMAVCDLLTILLPGPW